MTTGNPSLESDDPRARAARTKRDRTRAALLSSGEKLFAEHGWVGTRIEDIARDAGVSAATAYNHFPSKHTLIAQIYVPLIRPCLDRVKQDLADGTPVPAALERHVRDLAAVCSEHRALTGPFVYAVHDFTVRHGGPPEAGNELDPRNLAPIPAALISLIAAGQQRGDLRPYPPATEMGTQLTNLLLLRIHSRPNEDPTAAAEILLTLLFGTLRPEVLVDAGFTGRPFATGSRRLETS